MIINHQLREQSTSSTDVLFTGASPPEAARSTFLMLMVGMPAVLAEIETATMMRAAMSDHVAASAFRSSVLILYARVALRLFQFAHIVLPHPGFLSCSFQYGLGPNR